MWHKVGSMFFSDSINMLFKQCLLLMLVHFLLCASLTVSAQSNDAESMITSTAAPIDTSESVLPPSMGRDLLEYLMESASQARGQLPSGFLLPTTSSMLNAAEKSPIDRSFVNHTAIEPPALPIHQLNEQIRSISMAAASSSSSGNNGGQQPSSTNSMPTTTTPIGSSLLSKQTKSGPDHYHHSNVHHSSPPPHHHHHNSLASLASLYQKSFKPPIDSYRKQTMFARLPPTLRLPADRSNRLSFRIPANPTFAASTASAAPTLEKPSADLMKSADYSSQATEGIEDESMTNSHVPPLHSSHQAGASAPYFMREYRTFPSFASFGSSAYSPSAYLTGSDIDARHHPTYYQGHSAGHHAYYGDHHNEGLSAYAKSDYYWLIPVAFIIGAGALLLPIISVLMTTMVTSGSLTLSATKRRKREIDPTWQMMEQLQAWWKQFNLAMEKFDQQ